MIKRKLRNNWGILGSALASYGEHIKGVAVESTSNWYSLAASLTQVGYQEHQANPRAIRRYRGLMRCDDNYFALWLADIKLVSKRKTRENSLEC